MSHVQLETCQKTGKICFSSKGKAIRVLREMKKKARRRTRGRNADKGKSSFPTSCYECKFCGGYHHTSRKQRNHE